MKRIVLLIMSMITVLIPTVLAGAASWSPSVADWRVELLAESDQGLELRLILNPERIGEPTLPAPAADLEAAPLILGNWVALPAQADPVAEVLAERWTTGHLPDSDEPCWSLGTPVLWLGQRFSVLSVNPRGSDGSLLEELTLRITFSSAQVSNPGSGHSFTSLLQAERARDRALNSGLVERARAERTGDLPLGRYLVVGKNNCLSYMNSWAEWRRSQGYVVTVVSCESLGALGTNWEPIQSRAQELFAGEGLDYLLLVGDMNISGNDFHVPGDLVPGGQYAEDAWGLNIVTDHSLGMLEGDDYFSDILVGRLPADNATQLSVMVNRLVQYDQAPTQVDDQWTRKATVIYDVSGAGSRRESSLAIRQHLLEAGFSAVDTIRNDRYQNPLPPGVVTSAFNGGRTLVNYRGFGYRYMWNGPQFGVDQMDDLSNYGMWPLVTSIVCGGGDFANTNYDPCLGEGFLRAGSTQEPTGAIAFIGPSEEDTHSQWNNSMNLGIVQGLLREDVREVGALLERGKGELWHCFPNDRVGVWYDPGSPNQATNVRFYFYCYNLLGDPGTRLRLGEQHTLSAPQWQAPVEGATQVTVELQDESGLPASAVWVCLSDEEQEIVALGRTDENGRVELLTEPLAGDPLHLVAHADDYVPWLTAFTPAQVDSRIELQEWSLLPDDALIAAGDSLNLRVVLTETGSAGSPAGYSLTLASTDEGVELLTESLELPALEAGAVLEVTDLSLRVTPSVEAGQELALTLSLADEQGQELWHRALTLAAAGSLPSLTHLVVTPTLPSAGDSVDVVIQLRNEGELPLDATVGRLFAMSTALEVLDSTAVCETLAPSADGEIGPFRVRVTDAVLDGSQPGLELVFFRADGSTAARLPFTLSIGQVTSTDPTGPDDYGYLIYHDNDSGAAAPTYQWVDISSTGTEVPLDDEGVAFNEEGLDGESYAMALPFTFRFYGQDYDSLTISSNGWLAMGDQHDHILGLNTPIPAAQGPNAMVAVFWTDLYNYYGSSRFGHCYQRYDAAQHLFIVQWNNFQHTGHPFQDNWFQAILRDPAYYPTPTGDGEILLQYQDMITTLGEHYFTIGVERQDQCAGLQYTFNNQYAPGAQTLNNQTALLITTAQAFEETGLEPLARPRELEIVSATPNPFNPSTRMELRIPQAGALQLVVYNLRGQRVRSLYDGPVSAGTRSFTFEAGSLASGVYLVEARLGTHRDVRRVLLLP
jgi:hypothetical protein